MDASEPVILAPPPRPVPLALSVRVVLGGILTQIGWGFFAFGMVFVWVFDPGSAIASAYRFSGDLATAEGESLGWRATNLSINEVQVFETSYSFRSPDGYTLTGESYQTGGYVDAGQAVTIEYVRDDPTVSRIRGMRASSATVLLSFVYVFPLIGLALGLAGTRGGLRRRRLMATGRLALGTLKTKEPTNTRINEQMVYRYTFEFEAEGGVTHEAVGKTHRQYELEDEARERLVYDPRDPSEAVMLDELPCRPHIDERGNFTVEGSNQVLLAAANAVLPGLAALLLTAYFLR